MIHRRRIVPLLAVLFAGVLTTTAFAGCLESGEADVLATFYPMTFLAQQIGGDAVDVGQIIPEGTEPHEWDPSVRDLTRFGYAEIVVAQGLEFETWLQPILSNLGDSAPTPVLTGNEISVPDLEALADDHGHDEHGDEHGHDEHGDEHGHDEHGDEHGHNEHGDEHGHDEHGHDEHGDEHGAGDVHELLLIDRETGRVSADVHGDHWHGGLRTVPPGGHISVGARFLDDHGDEIPIGADASYQFTARLAHGAPQGIVEFEFHGDHLHIKGLQEGEVRVIFQLWHDDHAEWQAPPLWVRVGDDDHGHGPADPHTWMDPVLFAQQAIVVRDAMIAAFPQHEQAFRTNADELVQRLQELDAAYAERLSDCENRNIIVQHNAFAYLAHRYGFDVHSVMGLSPQAEPNPVTVARTVDKALEYNLSVVFTETLANPSVMNAIAQDANSKGAQVEVKVLSPLERRSPQEVQGGMDYVDIMYNNLDALADAMRC